MSTHTLSRTRLLTEVRAIVRRFPEAVRPLPLAVGYPSFEASFVVGGKPRHVRMTLPPGYPSLPPEVREIEAPGGRIVAPDNAPYRLEGGVLCLFPHGNDPQGWTPDCLAVEALERCIALFDHLDDVATGPRRLAFSTRDRLVVSPGAAQLMRLPRGWGALKLRRAGVSSGDWFVDAITARRNSCISSRRPSG